MAGESGPIAAIADRVSKELFSWFRWERVPVTDRNFDCEKQEEHAPRKSAQHTHPVDIVFHYVDPYSNRRVFLNTDLKSYSRTSIKASNVRTALKSLAQTIDCARVSEEWSDRYRIKKDSWEVRGLLFVYNHDAFYDDSFYSFLESREGNAKGKKKSDTSVRVEGLPLKEGQLLHIADPLLINYLTTVRSDVQALHYDQKFPRDAYYFFYPELQLHRTKGSEKTRPATIELLSGPYMIVRHESVKGTDDTTGNRKEVFPSGYLIYYNRPGADAAEFVYLFDALSRYQILNGDSKVRIRLAHHSTSRNALSNFASATDIYANEWGGDSHIRERLGSIEVEVLPTQRQAYAVEDIGWREK